MAVGKIKISEINKSVTQYKIEIDDIDISQYTKSVNIEMVAGHIPKVWVQLIGSVDIPENLLAFIVAEQDEPVVNRKE